MHVSSRHHNLRGEHVELVWGNNDVEGAFFCRVCKVLDLDETRLSKGKAIFEHEHENEEMKTNNK